ncbi:hypothetical protein Pd630_LPD12054 (plasmid) [Rhodococcus opacus PD630]|nr:hypothetical protein Pd630_LPD12054 [Rhodococcus opacus PD630]
MPSTVQPRGSANSRQYSRLMHCRITFVDFDLAVEETADARGGERCARP